MLYLNCSLTVPSASRACQHRDAYWMLKQRGHYCNQVGNRFEKESDFGAAIPVAQHLVVAACLCIGF